MEIEKIKDLPIFFIVGRPRTGSTLLQLFFDAHPNVQMPSECMFIGQLYPRFKNIQIWTPDLINDFIEGLKFTYLFTPDKFNLAQIKQDLLSNIQFLDIQTVFRIVIKNYNTVYPKKEIMIHGDKNPFYSQIFHFIFSIFKNAKYIHLVRDPRDNHISLFNSRIFTPSIAYNTKIWKRSAMVLEAYKKIFPARFYTLRYEDMVTDPEKYLMEICVFLGIPYAPEMLTFQSHSDRFTKVVFASDFYLKKFHTSILEPVNTKKIGLWKIKLRKRDIISAELMAGKFLELYQYERMYRKPNKFSSFYLIHAHLADKSQLFAARIFRKFSIKNQLKMAILIEKYIQFTWKLVYGKKKL